MATKSGKSFALTRECLLELAGLPAGVTRTDAAKRLGISKTTAGGYLASMCGDGSLARVSGVKEKRYCLPDMLTDDEIDASMTFTHVLRKAEDWQYVPVKGRVRSVFELSKADK